MFFPSNKIVISIPLANVNVLKVSGNQYAQVWARSNNNSLFVDDDKTSNNTHFERLPDGSLNIMNFTKDLADRYTCSYGPVSISHTVGYKGKVKKF